MAKYENIRALAKKQLQAVTESSDRWKAFLQTAAIAYNYSFPNQLLIHEQSPTATAVADIAYWNNNAGRWVKRGAHGIAVFDTRANSSRLRYLFDISDTIPRAEVPDALPWVITDQNWRPVWDKIVADNHADSIQSALLMLSTSCVAQRSAMFTTALGKAIDGSSLQWAKPDEQRQLFIIDDFGWPRNPDGYNALVKRVAKKAGLKDIHPHMFRHTFVSLLMSNPDIGVATVAAEAGHAQPSTTLMIYTQQYKKRRESIRNQLSRELYEK